MGHNILSVERGVLSDSVILGLGNCLKGIVSDFGNRNSSQWNFSDLGII